MNPVIPKIRLYLIENNIVGFLFIYYIYFIYVFILISLKETNLMKMLVFL